MFCPGCGRIVEGSTWGEQYVCRSCMTVATAHAPSDESKVWFIVDSMKQGKKIEAIKQLRELTGCGLKISKLIVEAMERLHREGA